MRPLVDFVRQAVPPVLEELGRRPRVVDLVEVHLVRLVEPPHADREHRDRQEDEDPHVELVEAPAALVVQQPASIGADG
jgi:hypothetical protein